MSWYLLVAEEGFSGLRFLELRSTALDRSCCFELSRGDFIDEEFSRFLHLEAQGGGVLSDYSVVLAYNLPVVSPELASLFQEVFADRIQAIRLSARLVDGSHVERDLINVLSVVDALDLETSEFEWLYVEKVRRRFVSWEKRLVFKEGFQTDSSIFRLSGFEHFIVIDENAKQVLERAGFVGYRFQEIGTPLDIADRTS